MSYNLSTAQVYFALLKRLLRLFTFGDILALSYRGYRRLATRAIDGSRIPQQDTDGAILMFDRNLYNLPSFAGCGFTDVLHGPAMAVIWEQYVHFSSQHFFCSASGETLEGMVKPGDLQLGIPDDNGSIGIVE
jgi:hypothetical protein